MSVKQEYTMFFNKTKDKRELLVPTTIEFTHHVKKE